MNILLGGFDGESGGGNVTPADPHRLLLLLVGDPAPLALGVDWPDGRPECECLYSPSSIGPEKLTDPAGVLAPPEATEAASASILGDVLQVDLSHPRAGKDTLPKFTHANESF